MYGSNIIAMKSIILFSVLIKEEKLHNLGFFKICFVSCFVLIKTHKYITVHAKLTTGGIEEFLDTF